MFPAAASLDEAQIVQCLVSHGVIPLLFCSLMAATQVQPLTGATAEACSLWQGAQGFQSILGC